MALPEPIPVEALFAPPARSRASLSPDGTKIAYLAPWRNRLNLWIENVDSPGSCRRVTAEDRGLLSYHWTDDPRWLLYTRDQGGDENRHLYRVDLKDPGAAAIDLTPFPGARITDLTLPAARPGKAVFCANIRDFARFDLIEADIASGELRTLATNTGDTATGFLYSSDGDPFATEMTAEGDVRLSRWNEATKQLSHIALFDGADYPVGVYPMEVTADGAGVLVGSSRGTDRVRLVLLDPVTGEETDVDSHAVHDLDTRANAFPQLPSPLILSRTGELIGVRYLGERQVIHALDPHFAEVLPHLEKLSDGDPADISCDVSGKRWVVSFVHDRDPGATCFYDHSTGEARLLFRPRPDLDPSRLASMTPVSITARDGLRLPSYLTLPVGIEPRGLPLVLLVHGGPWTRDSWGFNPAVQLFANRGYAVLQVNFRGSTGYGKAFTQAGIGQLAAKMHDDLIDGVNWAVGRGYGDPARVAIMGASYGGYAALVGVTFTPDVFAAAVDIVGISDLAGFMRSQPAFVRPALASNWYRYVGDPAIPEQEADMLARSPISRVDDVRTPLLIAQGANDARVIQGESDTMVDALRQRGALVEYMLMADEGHAIENAENLIALAEAVERFFHQHLRQDGRTGI
ncbi:S9 family peptidase (plasmid) [Streptomyces scopuliridis]|uniref:S9 family peptidase n=1 Tax=Streptomyces scopuliridis TaxID=452529 RepID=A0ACD4ZYV1_9ACTN|nr:S9 family peptidase [Streptomyces scopuliridis]WSC03483.1 S9 family peptidase [Streptomyces scopuliridis]WSC11372.1 S9 family peptidase [Streptomyces scopuliridis]